MRKKRKMNNMWERKERCILHIAEWLRACMTRHGFDSYAKRFIFFLFFLIILQWFCKNLFCENLLFKTALGWYIGCYRVILKKIGHFMKMYCERTCISIRLPSVYLNIENNHCLGIFSRIYTWEKKREEEIERREIKHWIRMNHKANFLWI